MRDVEKLIGVVLTIIASYVISAIVVDALSQVVTFFAWVVVTLILLKLFQKYLEVPTVNVWLIVLSGVVSGVMVLLMSSVILAFAKLGLTMLISYYIIKELMPEVLEEIKEVV